MENIKKSFNFDKKGKNLTFTNKKGQVISKLNAK